MSAQPGLPSWLQRRTPLYPTSSDDLGSGPEMPPAAPVTPIEPILPAGVGGGASGNRLPMQTVIPPSDVYATNRTIKPQRDTEIADPLAREGQYQKDVGAYEPQKMSTKEKILQIAMHALAGGRYGGAGLAGGAIEGAVEAFGNPRAKDKAWQQKELAKSGQAVAGLNDQADAGLNRQLKQAQIDKLEADKPEKSAQPAPTSKRVLTKEEFGLPIGTTIERVFNPNTKTFEDSVDKNGSAIVVGAAPEKKEVAVKTPPHVTISGSLYERGDDGTWKLSVQAPDKPEKPEEDFAETAKQIYKAASDNWQQAVKKRAEAAAINPTTALGADPVKMEEKKQLLNEAEGLEKQTRDWQQHARELEGKAKKTVAPVSRGAVVKPAKDGKYHYTAAQVRAAAESAGKTYDEVLSQLKTRSNVIIDE